MEFFSSLGSRMGTALYNGLASIGATIRGWFDSLVPDWAKNMLGGAGGGLSQGVKPPAAAAGEAVGNIFKNYQGNAGRTTDGKAVAGVTNDNRQDNSDKSMTVNTTVNQTVTQATNAPGQAAQAAGAAVAGAITSQRSQLEQGPAF